MTKHTKPFNGSSFLDKTNNVIFCENDKSYVLNCMSGIEESDICAVSIEDWNDFKIYDWGSLAGKNVYIWPNNKPKYPYLEHVQKKLEEIDPRPNVLWVNPKNLSIPAGGDLEDFIAKYGYEDAEAIKQVKAVLDSAHTTDINGLIKKRTEESIAGTRETIPLPWRELDEATMALAPGTITVLCGVPGASKSFMLTQMCEYWHVQLGHSVALFELEADREYHIMRMLAQKSGEPRITNDRWMRENPERTRKIRDKHKNFIKKVGDIIYGSKKIEVTLDDLAAWVKEQAKAGKRIICIDPITFAEPKEKPWIADRKFISLVQPPLVDYGASLVVVTHPIKGGGNNVGLDSVAGGTAWARFTQTVLWLKNLGDNQEVEIIKNGCIFKEKANRIVTVLKASNSFGGGRSFAMNMDKLVLHELGEEVKSKKGKS